MRRDQISEAHALGLLPTMKEIGATLPKFLYVCVAHARFSEQNKAVTSKRSVPQGRDEHVGNFY